MCRIGPKQDRPGCSVQIGLGGGFALNEPFFNTARFGGHLGYHFTETHAVILAGQLYQDGLGNNGKGLAATDLDNGSTSTTFIRMDFAPQAK